MDRQKGAEGRVDIGDKRGRETMLWKLRDHKVCADRCYWHQKAMCNQGLRIREIYPPLPSSLEAGAKDVYQGAHYWSKSRGTIQLHSKLKWREQGEKISLASEWKQEKVHEVDRETRGHGQHAVQAAAHKLYFWPAVSAAQYTLRFP